MDDRTTAWVDLVSPSHPFFFKALLDELPSVETRTTVRQKTETVDLADAAGFDYEVLGRDFDNSLLRKVGIPLRTAQLVAQAPSAEVSLSSRNAMCVLASKARNIPSIHFTDNDITAHVDGLRVEKLYNRFEAKATYNIVPEAFETRELERWGASPEQIKTYGGYKEDVYVANFDPDSSFTDQLPFSNYVVLRPEALGAAYVDAENSIVPKLLSEGVEEGLNFVYLPRGRGDEEHAEPFDDETVFTPEKALDGLQLAWHSDGVLTGSGTMAREAACMDIPAVSFFPNTPLSVDQEMIEREMIFHSRDAESIIQYISTTTVKERQPNRSRSKETVEEVVGIVERLMDNGINH